MLHFMISVIQREFKLHLRKSANTTAMLSFFLIAVVFFPLSLGPDEALLSVIGAGVIWVTALLCSLMSIPHYFQRDMEDGTLDQYRLLPLDMEYIVLAKFIAHWLMGGLLLAAFSPLLGMMLYIPNEKLLPLALSLALGTLTITCLGGMTAALIAGNQRAGALTAVLLMPLYIPILIFGSSSVNRAIEIQSPIELYILAGAALTAIPLCTWVAASLLREDA